jgi:hypothetical protein
MGELSAKLDCFTMTHVLSQRHAMKNRVARRGLAIRPGNRL